MFELKGDGMIPGVAAVSMKIESERAANDGGEGSPHESPHPGTAR